VLPQSAEVHTGVPAPSSLSSSCLGVVVPIALPQGWALWWSQPPALLRGLHLAGLLAQLPATPSSVRTLS
jgi:hypothetical protein